jgi:hypothetical protein
MAAYIFRRLLLMIPTIFGIMAISFVVVQFAPGGPVERVIAQLQGTDISATARIGGSSGGDLAGSGADTSGSSGGADSITSKYRGAQGLDPDFIRELEKQFGFDKPPLQRFGLMLWNYLRFDFGESYFRDITVLKLIKEKAGVFVRHFPHCFLRRRHVFRLVPAARPDIGQLVVDVLACGHRRLFLAPSPAADLHGAGRLRHDDAAHQEFLPR